MNVAFIPVRGGSKSIPYKNIKLLLKKPLVYWTIKAACESNSIDKVYVATDDVIIKSTVQDIIVSSKDQRFKKVEIIGRSDKTASDTASTESAMLEFADSFDFDNIVLIQATSPLLSSFDLDNGFEKYKEKDTDSVISVVRQKRFNWKEENGFAVPTNYDVYNRPRRQEFNGYLVENGAFYITSKSSLQKSKNRVSGNIKAVIMDEDSFFEIDEPSDWVIIESLMKKRLYKKKKKLNSEIKMFLTDCDGCLTDGGMYYSEKGDEIKKFNTKDGMGFQLLRQRGILTGVITGEDVALNKRRFEKLRIDIYEPGVKNKAEVVKRICKEKGIDLENVVYIGDDINDIQIMEAVGFSVAPANAVNEVKTKADYVTNAFGGHGVIREVVDLLI